jgi:type IV pilus assembly protein PilB
MTIAAPPTANSPAVRTSEVRDRPRQRSPIVPLPLGEILLSHGLLTEEELESALAERGAKGGQLGEVLVQLGFVDEETLLRCLGQQLQIPVVRLRDGLVDPAVVKVLPRAKAEALCALALFQVRGTLTVAMAEPQNLEQFDELERITRCRIRPVLALRSAIEKMLPRCYEDDFAVDAVTVNVADDAVAVESDSIDINLGDVQSLSEGSPIINLVNYLIVNAIRQKASDIHVEPGHQHSTVRCRVDGLLRDVLRPRREFHPAIVSRLKVMAKLDIAEHRTPQDGRIHVRVEGREIDLRISTLPTILGEKIVMRVLDRRNVTFNLDQLGVPNIQLLRIKEMLRRPYGLALVTGPTGSGKTTTLYSAIELIKSVHHNLVTVEDPVEYQLEQITQVQVGQSKAMSFAGALRAILRQDPDVVMLGEIRDADTAAVAIQAALTGHLVLSTMHTNDCVSAVTRLRDMGIESFKIAAALVGVVAQRLVRTICPACRTSYFPPAEQLETLRYQGNARNQFHRGEGCRECYDTGCKGRIGIYEVLWASREIRELISGQAELERLRSCHLQQGGTTLLQEAIRLAEEGKASLEEIMRVAFAD